MKLLARLVVLLLVCLGGLAAYLWLSGPQDPVQTALTGLPGSPVPTVRKPIRIGQPPGGRIEKSDEEWKECLSPEVFKVTRGHGTERAFCGAFWNAKGDGVYHCVCCDQPLFDSGTKFDSKTGWPSFMQPVDKNAISLYYDDSFGARTEVACSRCDAHLGHVFQDGPPPTGQRFCLNSVALKFVARNPDPFTK